ncbi:MAG: M48 family metallopeptidase [Candidatus Pacebacteria bacterium]|nr:M48 family metallopeptidase [Candidatus Paceibacterota bacterium]MBP9780874.1 M48 family metallopeptidase [Candidatus Paceibacterota bacterium]
MATLYTHQAQNIRKTWLLMTVFLMVVVGLGLLFSQVYGDPTILYFFVIFAIVMNITSYWFSDKIVVSLAGAKPADPKNDIELIRIVENLAITAGLPMPKVYIVQDSAPNAFATGRDPKHSVVAVTTGLMSILDRSELEGVIAHELAHIGNRDMLVSTVAVVLVGFISIISDVFLRMGMWGSGSRDNDNKGGNILMIVAIVAAILAPIAGMLLQLGISRRREYLADASGALLTRYPEGLANALRKIGGHSAPMKKQSTAIAHLYLADPKGKTSKMAQLFMTHPPMQSRINALLNIKDKS